MTKWTTLFALLIMGLSDGSASASDWRDNVKVWKVEPFFGAWIVVSDDSFAFAYKSRWRWVAVQEAQRLSAQHGGVVRIHGESADKEQTK